MAGVPQFGNWENDGSIPYTQYFERARNGRVGGKATNSSNLQEGNGSASTNVPPIKASPSRTKPNENTAKASDFSAPYENASRMPGGLDGGKATGNPQLRVHKTRPEHSAEKAPSERSNDFAPTPGRSRPQRSDEVPDKVTAIPKFGDWDEGNPDEGAVYTEVFKRVKDEKKNSSTKAPYIISEPEYSSSPAGANSGSCLLWCFSGKSAVAK